MPIGNGGIIGPRNVPTQLVASGIWTLDEVLRARADNIWPFIFPRVTGSDATVLEGTNTSYNAPLPDNIQAGERLVLLVANASGSALTVGTPSGWDLGFTDIGGGSLRRLSCFYKTATGLEGSTVALSASANSRWVSNSYRIADSGAIEFGTTATGTGSVANPPNLAPSWGAAYGTLWIAVQANFGNTATAVTAPANYTDLIQASAISGGDDSPRLASAIRLLSAAAENPGTFSGASGSNWAANTIGLRAA